MSVVCHIGSGIWRGANGRGFRRVGCRFLTGGGESARRVVADGELGGVGESKKMASFGFAQVEREQKSRLVGDVFNRVAGSYDLMNDVMSLGVHRLWKAHLVNMLDPRVGEQIVDVAGGTGDIACRIAERVLHTQGLSRPDGLDGRVSAWSRETGDGGLRRGKVVVCDVNESMLEMGRSKLGGGGNEFVDLEWVLGDAENLPFEDDRFDAYTIAFGIRNCTDIGKVLREAHRVLKSGGRFACLEFSSVRTPGISELYEFYSFNVIPYLGKLIAKDESAYRYLVESIREFPSQEKFKCMIEHAKFKGVSCTELTFGTVSIHMGFK